MPIPARLSAPRGQASWPRHPERLYLVREPSSTPSLTQGLSQLRKNSEEPADGSQNVLFLAVQKWYLQTWLRLIPQRQLVRSSRKGGRLLVNFHVEGTGQTTKGRPGLPLPVSVSKFLVRASLSSSLGMIEEAEEGLLTEHLPHQKPGEKLPPCLVPGT